MRIKSLDVKSWAFTPVLNPFHSGRICWRTTINFLQWNISLYHYYTTEGLCGLFLINNLLITWKITHFLQEWWLSGAERQNINTNKLETILLNDRQVIIFCFLTELSLNCWVHSQLPLRTIPITYYILYTQDWWPMSSWRQFVTLECPQVAVFGECP